MSSELTLLKHLSSEISDCLGISASEGYVRDAETNAIEKVFSSPNLPSELSFPIILKLLVDLNTNYYIENVENSLYKSMIVFPIRLPLNDEKKNRLAILVIYNQIEISTIGISTYLDSLLSNIVSIDAILQEKSKIKQKILSKSKEETTVTIEAAKQVQDKSIQPLSLEKDDKVKDKIHSCPDDFMKYLSKMKGGTVTLLKRYTLYEVINTWLGVFIAIAGALLMFETLDILLASLQTQTFSDTLNPFILTGSYGALATLLYGLPSAPLAQPRVVCGAHFIASLIAVLVVFIFIDVRGHYVWIQCGLAVAFAVVTMGVCQVLHPPAGAIALIVTLYANGETYSFKGLDFVIMEALKGKDVDTLAKMYLDLHVEHEKVVGKTKTLMAKYKELADKVPPTASPSNSEDIEKMKVENAALKDKLKPLLEKYKETSSQLDKVKEKSINQEILLKKQEEELREKNTNLQALGKNTRDIEKEWQEKLNSITSKYETQISQIQGEKDSLQSKIETNSNNESVLKKLQNDWQEKLSSSTSRYETQISQLQGEKDDISKNLEKEWQEKLKIITGKFETQITEIKGENEILQSKVASNSNDASTTKNLQKEWQEKLSSITSKYEAQILQLKGEKESLQSKAVSISDTNETIVKNLEKDWQLKFDYLKSECEKKIIQHEAHNSELSAKLSEADKIVSIEKAKVAERLASENLLKGQVESLTEQITNLKTANKKVISATSTAESEEIIALKEKLNKLMNVFQELKTSSEEAKKKNDSLENEGVSLKDKLNKLVAFNNDLKKNVEDHKKKEESLQNQISKLQLIVTNKKLPVGVEKVLESIVKESLSSPLSKDAATPIVIAPPLNSNGSIPNLSSPNESKLKERIEELEKEKVTLIKTQNDVKARVDELEKEKVAFIKKQNDSKIQVDELEKEKFNLVKLQTDTKSNIDELEKEKVVLVKKQSESKLQVDELEKVIQSLKQDIQILITKIEKGESEIHKKEESLKEVISNNKELGSKYQTTKTEYEELQDKESNLRNQYSSLQNINNSLQASYSEQSELLHKKSGEYDVLKNSLSVKDEEISSLKMKLGELNLHVQTLDSTLKAISVREEKITSELESSLKSCMEEEKTLRESLNGFEGHLALQKIELEGKVNEINTLNVLYTSKEEELKDAHGRIASLLKQVQDLESSYKSLEDGSNSSSTELEVKWKQSVSDLAALQLANVALKASLTEQAHIFDEVNLLKETLVSKEGELYISNNKIKELESHLESNGSIRQFLIAGHAEQVSALEAKHASLLKSLNDQNSLLESRAMEMTTLKESLVSKESELFAANTKIAELSSQLMNLESSYKSLNEGASATSSQLEIKWKDAMAEIGTLQTSQINLQTSLSEQSRVLESKAQEISTLKLELSTKEIDYASVSNKMSELFVKAQDLETSNTASKSILENKEKELVSLQEKLSSLGAESESSLKSKEEEIRNIGSKILVLQTSLDSLRIANKMLEESQASINNQHELKHAQNNLDLDDLRSKFSALQTDFQTKEQKLADENTNLHNELNTSVSSSLKQKHEIEDLITSLKETEEKNTSINKELSILVEKCKQNDLLLRDRDVEIVSLHAKHNDLQASLDNKGREINVQLNSINDLNSQIATLNSKIERLTSDNSKAESEISNLKEQNKASEQSLKKSKEQLDINESNLKESKVNWEMETSSLNNKISELNSRVTELQGVNKSIMEKNTTSFSENERKWKASLSDLEEAKSKLATIEQEFKTKEDKMLNEIATLQTNFDKIKGKYSDLNMVCTKQKEDYDKLVLKTKELSSRYKGLQADLLAAQESERKSVALKSASEQELFNKTLEVKDVEMKLKDSEAKIKQLQTLKLTQDQELATLNSKAVDTKLKITNIQNENKLLTEKLQLQETDSLKMREELRKKVDTFSKVIEELETKVKILTDSEAQLSHAKRILEQSSSQEILSLKSQLQVVNDQLVHVTKGSKETSLEMERLNAKMRELSNLKNKADAALSDIQRVAREEKDKFREEAHVMEKQLIVAQITLTQVQERGQMEDTKLRESLLAVKSEAQKQIDEIKQFDGKIISELRKENESQVTNYKSQISSLKKELQVAIENMHDLNDKMKSSIYCNADWEPEVMALRKENEDLKEKVMTGNQQIAILTDVVAKRSHENSNTIGRAHILASNIKSIAGVFKKKGPTSGETSPIDLPTPSTRGSGDGETTMRTNSKK